MSEADPVLRDVTHSELSPRIEISFLQLEATSPQTRRRALFEAIARPRIDAKVAFQASLLTVLSGPSAGRTDKLQQAIDEGKIK